jgi:hypothetical protein
MAFMVLFTNTLTRLLQKRLTSFPDDNEDQMFILAELQEIISCGGGLSPRHPLSQVVWINLFLRHLYGTK